MRDNYRKAGSGRGVTFDIGAGPRGYAGLCGSGARACMWRMACVAHRGTCVLELNVIACAKRGCSWIGIDQRGRRSSLGGGGVCDILAYGLIRLIGYSYQQGIHLFFMKLISKEPPV
jgi:hypothetical protein